MNPSEATGDAGHWASIFLQVSFWDATYRALCQGGVVNKIADTLGDGGLGRGRTLVRRERPRFYNTAAVLIMTLAT